jgi:hypothetical protein
MTYINDLEKLNACEDAVEWCKDYKTLQAAWNACKRGDWMLWLIGRMSGPSESASRKKLVLIACQCARLSLLYVRAGEKRPLRAIETAERWANGDSDITLDDVRKAADGVGGAAYAVAAVGGLGGGVGADAGADAAAYAAAYGVAYGAAYAVADAVAYAVVYGGDGARNRTLKRCANIVRKAYPKVPKIKK